MKRWLVAASVALFGLALAACGAEADVEVGTDTAAALDRIETGIDELGAEIEGSALAQDLQSGWEEVEADLTEMVESVRAGEAVDTEAVEAGLDEFQDRLQSVEVEEGLEDAWSRLRAGFDALMAELG